MTSNPALASHPKLNVLTPDERNTYSSLHLRLPELSDTDYKKYNDLIKKIHTNAITNQNEEIGGKSRRNPSKKAPTSRRRRSSKARKSRKARTTRRKY